MISVHDLYGLKASSTAFSKAKDGIWSQMLSNDVITEKVRNIVESGLMVRVGNGKSTLFWLDKWCDCSPLYLVFPRLYSLSLQKNHFISQMGEWHNGVWSWSFSWRRAMFDWEIEEVGRLEDILAIPTLCRERMDRISWYNTSGPNFPLKSITDKLYDDVAPILPKKTTDIIWCKFYPPRAQLTMWLACLERLKTGDKLVELGIIDVNQALCPLCRVEMESNAQIILTCRFSWEVWMDILKWWGIKGVLHSRCSSFVIEWDGLMQNHKWKNLWRISLGCCIWSLWLERNNAKFGSTAPDLKGFILNLKVRICLWAKEFLGCSGFSPHDFINNLEAIIL